MNHQTGIRETSIACETTRDTTRWSESSVSVNSSILEKPRGRAHQKTYRPFVALVPNKPQVQPALPDTMPPVTAALPLHVRDIALKAIGELPNMHEKIRAVRHLENAAGISLDGCRWSEDIKRLHEARKALDASIMLDAAIRSILDIPPGLSPYVMQ